MAATYTDLTEVKRVLRSSDKEVVRFSDSLVSVRLRDSSNGIAGNPDMGFDFTKVSVDPSFNSKFQLLLRFSDPTTFDAYKVNEDINQEQLLSTGQSIGSNYTTPDGKIAIDSAAWFGTIEAGDELILTFDSHMSDNDAERYIEEAEVEVDGMLSASTVDQHEDGEIRHFDPTDPDRPVPAAIKVATTYLAAYYIYTDTFAFINKAENTRDYNSYASRWKSRAEKYIKDYIKTQGYAPPEAAAFPKFIDRFGVRDEGPGLAEMEETQGGFERDAQTEDIFSKMDPINE